MEASLHEYRRRTDGMNHFLDAVAAPRFLEDLLTTRNDDVVLHRMATRLREAYGKKDSSNSIYLKKTGAINVP